MAAWVWQAPTVRSEAQVSITAGAEVTVKVELLTTSTSQSLVAVHVTVVDPPHAAGAPAALLVTLRLHPPPEDTPVSHVAYLASIVAWVWQGDSVAAAGAVSTTTGDAVAVNVFVQVTGSWQSLVTVQVTDFVSPQAAGGPVLLFVSTQLQLLMKEAEASQAA
jgi:hypothetical protein